MKLRNLPSRAFYAPLRATEAAVSTLYVLARYAGNLLTSYSVKTRKPSRYRELTAARIHEDVKRNGKAPPPSPAPAVPKARDRGPGRNMARGAFAEDIPPPPRSGENIPYPRWAWFDCAPD